MWETFILAASTPNCIHSLILEAVIPGTGDLFASCMAAAMVREIPLSKMIQTAGAFLEKSLADTVAEGIPPTTALITNSTYPC